MKSIVLAAVTALLSAKAVSAVDVTAFLYDEHCKEATVPQAFEWSDRPSKQCTTWDNSVGGISSMLGAFFIGGSGACAAGLSPVSFLYPNDVNDCNSDERTVQFFVEDAGDQICASIAGPTSFQSFQWACCPSDSDLNTLSIDDCS